MLVTFTDFITKIDLFQIGLSVLPRIDDHVEYTPTDTGVMVDYEVKKVALECSESPDVLPNPPLPGVNTFGQMERWRIEVQG